MKINKNKKYVETRHCLVSTAGLFLFLFIFPFVVSATYLPGAATTLTGLSDINTATATYGALFVADGTDWESVTAPLFVDTVNGRIGVGTTTPGYSLDVSGTGKFTYVSSVATNAAAYLISTVNGGTVDTLTLQRQAASGSARIGFKYGVAGGNDAGAISASSGGLTVSTALASNIYLSPNNTAIMTIEAGGNVGIGNTNPNDVLDVVGYIDATSGYKINGSAFSLTGLSDVTSATATAGRILVSDGTDFESVAVSGDCTLVSDGTITCSSVTNLTGLSDVNTATATRGAILVADGTDWESVTAPVFVDTVTERIGIGTTVPAAQLDLFGTSNKLNISYDNTNYGSIYTTQFGILTLNSNNATYVTIADALRVTGNIIYFTGGDANTKNVLSLSSNNTYVSAPGVAAGGGNLIFRASPTNDEIMYISRAGNVGIGISAPDDKFAVVGNIDLTGTLKIGGTAISLTGLSDVNSDTATAGRILVADGTDFESVAVSGDCTLASDGTITCSSATSLTGLSDVNTATATRGAILVADGTDWESVTAPLFVDTVNARVGVGTTAPTAALEVEFAGNGAFLVDGASDFIINTASTGVSFGAYDNKSVSIMTNNSGKIFIKNSGEVGIGTTGPNDRLDVSGVIDATGYKLNGTAISLTGLSDVNSDTATAGRILVADGTDFESVAISGDATLASDGTLTLADGATSLTGLSDVNTATATAGRILVADGTDWESVDTIFVDHINSEVGIGTTAPNAPLSVNGNIEIDPTPSADNTSNGIIAVMTVDVNATGFGAALHMDTDGNWIEADASASTTMPCAAIALEAGTGSKKVLLQGFVRDTAWTWTVGGIMYVSATTGALTQSAPATSGDQVQSVGVATAADTVFFNPNYVIVQVQ